MTQPFQKEIDSQSMDAFLNERGDSVIVSITCYPMSISTVLNADQAIALAKKLEDTAALLCGVESEQQLKEAA